MRSRHRSYGCTAKYVGARVRSAYLNALGLETWARRVRVLPDQLDRRASLDWSALRIDALNCVRCSACTTRTQTVFSQTNLQAQWLLIGDLPDLVEDRQGEPFVGDAGILLNAMLGAIGLSRNQVYMTHVQKCRATLTTPTIPALVECFPFLDRQVQLLAPKIMLVMGEPAAQGLLHSEKTLDELRQQVHVFGKMRIPLIATYHPAHLLRIPADKRKAWEDLKFAREVFVGG